MSSHVRFATLFLASVVGVCFSASGAFAEPLFSGSPTGELFYSAGGVNFGYGFYTGNQEMLVSHLGYWDESQNGLLDSHPVGLWQTSTASFLATTTIQAGTASPLDGEFRYEPITPVTLNPLSHYVLIAFNAQDQGDLYARDTHANVIANGDFFSQVSVSGGGIAFSSSLGPILPTQTLIRIGPNLLFTVPEPSAGILMALGLVSLAWWRCGGMTG